MADLLLVDNDRRLAELCGWFLERRGHRVRYAVSYAEAREQIRERLPDLMLADLELGRESGREELPRLAAEGALPPTLVVSGYLDRAVDAELCSLAQVRGTLPKPFDVHELVQCVERAVAGSALPGVGVLGGIPSRARPPIEPASRAQPEARVEDADGWIEIVPRGGGAA